MASVARASYQVFVSWAAYNIGFFTLGFSTLSGTDVLGVSPGDQTFTGPYDDLSDRVARIGVSRGRGDTLETMLAGEATLDVRDPDGLFNPSNFSSPLAGVLSDRLHPVKITMQLDPISTPGPPSALFYGWIRRFNWEPQGRKGITQFECVDLFYRLERSKPIVAATGPTTTGAAIGKILDATGLADPSMRDLNVGDAIPDFAADGSKSALELIGDLLEAERGIFFIAGDGRATYRSRLTRQTSGNVGTIDSTMKALGPGADFDQPKTRVTVTRTQSGHIATAIAEAVRLGKFGYADLPAIETAYLASDGQADSLASWLLSQVDTARPLLYNLQIDNRIQALLTQIAEREIGDRITVAESKLGTTGEYLIENMEHSIDGGNGRHTADYTLSRAAIANPFVIGSSTIQGSDVFVY